MLFNAMFKIFCSYDDTEICVCEQNGEFHENHQRLVSY